MTLTRVIAVHRTHAALSCGRLENVVRCVRSCRELSTGSGKKRVWTRREVEAAAAAQRRHEEAVHQARYVSSWMMPWERAQMDAPARPLRPWERVYWRLFIVLGSVGFAYETWVLGNRRVWVDDRAVTRNPTSSNTCPSSVSQSQDSVLDDDDGIHGFDTQDYAVNISEPQHSEA